MTSYLLDTNHAAYIMHSGERLKHLLTQHIKADSHFFISVTILSELYFAAYASRRREHNLQNILRLLNNIPVLMFDLAVAEECGRIKAELKAKGRPIPGTDAQIAAIARLHNLTVLTADRHFSYVDNLKVENWLQSPLIKK